MRKMLESGGFTLPYSPEKPRKHEFVVSASPLLQSQGVTAGHVAKRLLDHGIHAPTMYFPPIVPEALMVEPTETVSKEELDGFIQAVARVVEEARTSPERVREAPTQVASTKVDEVKASHPRTLCVTYRKYVELYAPHNAK
jgi:glycine dehydrogenase subunit 2